MATQRLKNMAVDFHRPVHKINVLVNLESMCFEVCCCFDKFKDTCGDETSLKCNLLCSTL